MLSGLTAFVTGASGGLGREIAITLANHGANVAIAARSDGIYETADLVGDDRSLALETDVTDEASVGAAIDAAVERFGGLDCVVNNAGIAGPVLPYDRIEEADFTHTLDVNVIGAWRCVKHAAPHLRASERGSVVNIGSIGGKMPYPNRLPYGTSKMAMIGLTRTLSHELGRDAVTVNVVSPGPVAGSRIEDVIAAQAAMADMEHAEPFSLDPESFALEDFLVPPEDVAEQVAYLAGPHARKITGQEFTIDAGKTPF